jgi:hypothetical protein
MIGKGMVTYDMVYETKSYLKRKNGIVMINGVRG